MFQAEDGIRDLVRSRGLGDVYKRQPFDTLMKSSLINAIAQAAGDAPDFSQRIRTVLHLSLIHI